MARIAACLLVTAVFIKCCCGREALDSLSHRQVLEKLASLLSKDSLVDVCRRKLSLGGSCECNFRDYPGLTEGDIKFDKHVYGRRKVCIDDGYYSRTSCATISVQEGTLSGEVKTFRSTLNDFGCPKDKTVFVDPSVELTEGRDIGVRAMMKRLGMKSLNLLDISAPRNERTILADILKKRSKKSLKQITLNVIFDAGEAVGEDSTYSEDISREYLQLVEDLLVVGYKMMSYFPNPKCVKSIQDEFDMCIPIFADTTWIK